MRALVFTLDDATLLHLAGLPCPPAPTPAEVLRAALAAYDQRGGATETQIKGSKQGLGLTKRNKHRFPAQEMLVLLAQLAYNFIIMAGNVRRRAQKKEIDADDI